MPAFNAEKYISQTIQSVINQTYLAWELIIIDDGSLDQTSRVIESFLFDQRIKYFYQKNHGVSAARNNGISMTSGSFIALLDADDVWAENNLQVKLERLISENIDFIYSDAQLIDTNNQVIQNSLKGNDQNILEYYLLWKETAIPAPCSNLIIKRIVFEKSSIYFDPQFSTAADQDFCIRMSANHVGRRIPCVTFSYRILPMSMSRNMKIFEKDHIGVYRKASRLNLFKSYCFEQQCFSSMYMILAGSWWVNGKRKDKAIYYLCRSFISSPQYFFSKLLDRTRK